MKICDRHYYTDGSSVPATGQVTIESTDETWDLCESCLDAVRRFVTEPNPPAAAMPQAETKWNLVSDEEKRRGRPRKAA